MLVLINPTLAGILIPSDGGGGGGRWKPHPLLNYFLMVDFVGLKILKIYIALCKIQYMGVLGHKLWILWPFEEKNSEILEQLSRNRKVHNSVKS